MDRSSPTPTSPEQPGIRTLSGRPARFARTTATRSCSRATALFRRAGSARTEASACSTSDASWSSKVSLSEDLRNELSAIAPRSDCDRLAEISGLFHSAGSVHLRGRGEVSLHLDVASSGVARRAFRLLRDLSVGSEIRTYRQHAFEQATRYQLHVDGDDRALQTLFRAGVLTQRLAPLEHPPRR